MTLQSHLDSTADLEPFAPTSADRSAEHERESKFAGLHLHDGEKLVEIQIDPVRFDATQSPTYYVDLVVLTEQGHRHIQNVAVASDRLEAHVAASRLASRYNLSVRHHALP